MPITLNSYSELRDLLNEFVRDNLISVDGSPHADFWNSLTYDQFLSDDVPRLPGSKILIRGDGDGSDLVKSLQGQLTIDGRTIPRMPLGGPFMPPEMIALVVDWIDRDCPNPPESSAETERHWRATSAPTATRYDDVWFQDPDVGWAVNSNGEIRHTKDGGANWELQLHDPDVYLRCVDFASATRGWVGTLTAVRRLFETSDGGQVWTPVTSLPAGAPVAVCGLCVVNESVIIAAGSNVPERPVAMMRSTDGGLSWTAQDMRPWADNLIDVYFPAPDRGWVVGGKADDPMPSKPKLKPVVLYTEDGGQTWVDQTASLRPEFPLGEWGWKIHFVDDRTGFISLQNYFAGAILTTSDGGLNWSRHPINDPQMNANIEGIGFLDAHHGWVGGWGDHPGRMKQSSSETLDGGLTWKDANEIGKNINRFRFLGTPPQLGYSSGRTIYKYSSEPVPSTAVADLAPRMRFFDDAEPAEAVGTVTLEVTVPSGASRLTVRIWDTFGDRVRTLIDEPKPMCGRRRLSWDRTDDQGRLLPPNAFIWRVTVDQISESRLVFLS